jgi:hypothetical protein
MSVLHAQLSADGTISRGRPAPRAHPAMRCTAPGFVETRGGLGSDGRRHGGRAVHQGSPPLAAELQTRPARLEFAAARQTRVSPQLAGLLPGWVTVRLFQQLRKLGWRGSLAMMAGDMSTLKSDYATSKVFYEDCAG